MIINNNEDLQKNLCRVFTFHGTTEHGVKIKNAFSLNENHSAKLQLRIRQLIFIRLTAERDNLMQLYGWIIPYTCLPYCIINVQKLAIGKEF